MFRNHTLFSMITALFIAALSTQAQAQTLPKECANALMEYRGNFQINELSAQIASAKKYRATVLPKRTAEDKANLKRIDAVIKNLHTKYADLNAVQLSCMYINPKYSPYMNFESGVDVGFPDGYGGNNYDIPTDGGYYDGGSAGGGYGGGGM